VVIGGLISATCLTLFIFPIIFNVVCNRVSKMKFLV
jgi:Cu/Ag efflux pump CusA